KDANGNSAILLSKYHYHQPIADLLLAAGPRLSLFESAALGLTDQVRTWLAGNPGAQHAFSHDGFTALHLAAFFGHLDATKILLEHGSKVSEPARNQTFAQAVTPLHSALGGRSTAAAQLLVDHGADLNARDGAGNTPLHSAAFTNNLEMVKLLLARGAVRN